MNEAGGKRPADGNVRRLSDVIREVKNHQADRDDVVVEMREAQRTRLELLAQELEPVFADIPEDAANFDLAISSGMQPRLWIDAVTHVTMGRDRRTYRFLRDTRLGRVVLAESSEIKPVADSVARYIAERLVERQRMIDGDVEAVRPATQDGPEQEAPSHETAATTEVSEPVAVAETETGRGAGALLSGLLFVLVGGAVGIGAMLFVLRDRLPELSSFF
ncbi:MAG: hypothetical protein H6893_11910 [Brucellaceae bacterium]|nr:hypothetical protein [Brucellaceae bacterium]